MTSRTFATWVEPIATRQQDTAAQIVELARSMPAEAWIRPSPLEGWTYKDLLAHLASNDDLRYLLSSVIAGERADPSRFVAGAADGLNARNVAERRDRTVEELITEFEAQEEATQDLLARLTEADADRRQEDVPLSLGEGLGWAEPGFHYREHLAQLRTALETT